MTLAQQPTTASGSAPLPGSARRRPAPRPRLLGLARRHAGLLVLLTAGALLRLAVVAAYVPAFWYPDSVDYVAAAHVHRPLVHRPYGYSAFLSVTSSVLPLRGIVVLQHLLGLGCVVLVYALLQRRGVRRSVSLLAVAPLALDAYVLDIEHYVLAESLFLLLLALAVAVLLWRGRPGPGATAVVGLLLGGLALTRTVGSSVAALVLLYLLVRVLLGTVRRTALLSCAAALAVVVVPYMAWFSSAHGAFAITDYTGHFLYGRVSNIARCEELRVPARLQGLCPLGRPDQRPTGDWYVWDVYSPANYAPPGGRPQWTDRDLEQFAKIVIEGQPRDFALLTLRSTLHYAAPVHFAGPKDNCLHAWRFPDGPPPRSCPGGLATTSYDGAPAESGMRLGLAHALRGYQDVAFTPGTLLGLCALAGVAALVVPGGRGGSRERLDPALLAGIGVVLVAVPSATAAFDYRYLLPTLVVLPLAAALATQRLRPR